MTYINSNMTHREALNLHGSLPADRIEELIDDSEELNSMRGIEHDLNTVAENLPNEDFLNDEVKKLKAISDKMRGANKESLLAVIEIIEQELDEQARAIEFAVEALDNAASKIP